MNLRSSLLDGSYEETGPAFTTSKNDIVWLLEIMGESQLTTPAIGDCHQSSENVCRGNTVSHQTLYNLDLLAVSDSFPRPCSA